MQSFHLIISGKVQGVFFRATAKKVAEKYNITGWIKNSPVNKVEAIISGDSNDVKKFIHWCNDGPSGAKVSQVEIVEEPITEFSGFKIIR